MSPQSIFWVQSILLREYSHLQRTYLSVKKADKPFSCFVHITMGLPGRVVPNSGRATWDFQYQTGCFSGRRWKLLCLSLLFRRKRAHDPFVLQILLPVLVVFSPLFLWTPVSLRWKVVPFHPFAVKYAIQGNHNIKVTICNQINLIWLILFSFVCYALEHEN